MKTVTRFSLVVIAALLLSPGVLHAWVCSVSGDPCSSSSPCPAGQTCQAEMNDYCITPPFISASIPPNLLLMVDNSASMYDLQYQDTSNMYCANSTTTSCNPASPGTTCTSKPATCKAAGATTITSSAASCTTDAACALLVPGDTCVTTGSKKNTCKVATVSTTTFTPKACSTNADCTSGINAVVGDTCNNSCSVTHACYDTTYSAANSYYGYFDNTATYTYDFTNSKFTSGATMPAAAGCTHKYPSSGTLDFCIKTTGTGTSEAVVTTAGGGGFTATGNFLNWLSASKFDIEKQILTGGKYAGGNLVAESRGCSGREFLKAVSGVDITFSIRGGTPGGIGTTQSLATEYGQTYIEIYSGVYNASDCLAASNDWMNVTSTNLGPFQNDTKGCVGAGNGVLDATNVWNHILHNCYQGMTGGAGGYATNLNSLEGECVAIWASTPANTLNDPNSGAAVCSSTLTYDDSGGTAKTGYLGACYSGGAWDNTCALARMADYCTVNVTGNPVVDPSTTAVSGSTVSAPGFILGQGLMNTVQIGTFRVQVAKATAPTGLIDKYKDQIRFGAMTFQNNGSGSECVTTNSASSIPCAKACSVTKTRVCLFPSDCPSGEACNALPYADGGQIIGYVGAGACFTGGAACKVDSDCTGTGNYCVPSIGDHSTGLVNAIDSVPATSWTPYSESFYNAMGYFARTNDYATTPPMSRSDGDFNQLPAPNTATSYLTPDNPSKFNCQRNNILLITDGMSTADLGTTTDPTTTNSASEKFAALYAGQIPYFTTIGGTTYKPGDVGYDSTKNHGYDSTNKCPTYSGSRSIAALSWVAKHRDIKTLAFSGTASTTAPTRASESITTYVVYSGQQTSGVPGLCDPKTLMANTATNGGSTLFTAADPAELQAQLNTALSQVAAQSSSGTAASILSNSEGSGANILQAVFYPKKDFNTTSVNWIGEIQNLWYFVDPYVNSSTIREDTVADFALNLVDDKIVHLDFDTTTNQTVASIQADSNGDGVGDGAVTTEDPDLLKSLWRAGKKLWSRDIATSPRTIKTTLNGTSLINFSSSTFPGGAVADNSTLLAPYLNVPEADAPTLINWVHGQDQTDYRKRYVDIKDPSTNVVSWGTWRLGDIISSTPRVQSTVRLNTYNLLSPGGYSDNSYLSYINSRDYQSNGMVYVGGNDGMMHAFKLGTLSVKASGMQKATLSDTDLTTLGKEMWAFIPKNALPYLQYIAGKGGKEYGHLYTVDGRTLIFDASVGYTGSGTCVRSTYETCSKLRNSVVVDSSNNLDSGKNTWRTIVLGGMGIGGASTKTCAVGAECVQTPLTDPGDTDTNPGLGYSSYFAFDVTSPNSPVLLWEFSNPELGYTLTGPAIVRIGSPELNGNWYAVFGSGPTGPIDTGAHQFLAKSNQNLKFFVVDLQKGTLVNTIDTGITNAFAGSMLGGSIDTDRSNPYGAGNYQDDAIYVGYVKKDTSVTPATWTKGGVGRIMTKETPMAQSPAAPNWSWSKIIDDIGPVTTSIARLQDKKNRNLWLFFGTGRYFFRNSTTLDDFDGLRALYGIKDPCYTTSNTLDPACTAPMSGSVVNQTSSISTLASTNAGWSIDLDANTTADGAERVVTDTVALTNGTVFFTSFKPTTDLCQYGGSSFLWGVNYSTGGQVSSSMQGKALIQLSTGAFKEVDLSSAFTDKLNRRMATPMTGKPPTDSPPIVTNSSNKPIKKILHIQEH